ncbi:MAG TPA: type II secretion system F family protein, partial [Chthonomonadaceae bacterium]|nr:type II secretion system F family protein [Chthonomonadaceae bacterium]
MEFVIRAIDSKGGEIEEQLRAGNENEAVLQMHRRGYTILRLSQKSEQAAAKPAATTAQKPAGLSIFARRVPFQEVVALTRQLSVMIETAVPLDEALAALAENTDDAYLRDAFQTICEKVS